MGQSPLPPKNIFLFCSTFLTLHKIRDRPSTHFCLGHHRLDMARYDRLNILAILPFIETSPQAFFVFDPFVGIYQLSSASLYSMLKSSALMVDKSALFGLSIFITRLA